MAKTDQYTRSARGWSDDQYADSRAYLEHRAELVFGLGPPLQTGDEVLDLACGDGGLGAMLIERGLRYRGVDTTPGMVAAAQARLGRSVPVEIGNLNDYADFDPARDALPFAELDPLDRWAVNRAYDTFERCLDG